MELKELTTEDLQKSFYEKKFYFSYSSLNKLLHSPTLFYKDYILGEKEELTQSYLTEGKVIHCLLLEPEKFEDNFVIMTGKMPSENTKNVIDRVYAHYQELYKNGEAHGHSLADYQNAVIDILKDMNLHQSLKTDEQRFAKIYTADANIYWDFLKKAEGKIVVPSDVYDKCKEITDKLKADPIIQGLMRFTHASEWWDTTEVYNEFPIEMSTKKFNFGLKGILDNVVVDPIGKIIKINDIKTTSKTLKEFPETIKFYRYDLQAAMYNLLIINKFEDLIKQGGFKIEFRFIVIDKYQQYYPFLVGEDTMLSWMKELHAALSIANYHYTNKDYTLPYEFVNGYIL
jgi:hypothetical protein